MVRGYEPSQGVKRKRLVLEECDSIIVLSPDDYQLYEMLCEFLLKYGKPVFVENTLRYTHTPYNGTD